MTMIVDGLGAVGLLIDRTGNATRVGAFLRKRCVVDGYVDGALVWARVCGYGIAITNTRFARSRGPEDRGDAASLGPFQFTVLTPRSRTPRIDAAAARQLREL